MSYPSSIRLWDWNPQPLEREFPPITTRPGLSPKNEKLLSRPLKMAQYGHIDQDLTVGV